MFVKTWNIEALTGYKPMTTFYEDFSIADAFGVSAINDTYKSAFIMVLNWKIWEHYEKNDAYAELYNDLWRKADEWALMNLRGEALKYYLRTTD